MFAGRRSYPTFPSPLRVSYLIQIRKTIQLKFKRCRALSSPPLPSVRSLVWRSSREKPLSISALASGWTSNRSVAEFRMKRDPADRRPRHTADDILRYHICGADYLIAFSSRRAIASFASSWMRRR